MYKKIIHQFAVLFVLSVILLCHTTVGHAQKVSARDSLHVVSLYEAAASQNDLQVQMKYADSVVSFSTQKHFFRGLAWGYKLKTILCMRANQTDKALLNIDKGIDFARRGHLYKELVEQLLLSSLIRNDFAFYDKAFEDATKAVGIATKLKDTTLLGRSYTQLGRCYYTKEDYQKAMAYNEKALALFRKSGDIANLRETLITLATANIDDKKFEKGLAQLKEVENGSPNIPIDPTRLPQLYGNIGYCYDMMKDVDKAIKYYNMALDATKLPGGDFLHTTVVIKDNLGDLYTAQGKYALAEKYLNEALAGAMQVQTPDEFKSIYEHLSKLAFLKKDYKKAYEFQEKRLMYADSVMNNEKMEALESLSVKFQTKEVENKNKLLEKQNALQKAYAEQEKSRKDLILYSSVAIVLFLLTLLLLGYYYFRQKNIVAANKTNELQQKLLITQMNPHFIFNSIDNIQSLIYNKQDREAVKYLTKFSKLTRQILENSNETYILLSEELIMIDNYLVIQQLLYNNAFDFSIAVEDNIDTETILLPPMLTQPFIENAIKHGIQGTKERGMIAIRFSLKDAKLYFEVKDNGSGFGASPKDSNHKSLAMTITKERLVNYTKKSDFTVQTENVLDQYEKVIGAKVIFEIPYIYEN